MDADELKLLVTLAGGRVIHLEDAIFQDEALANTYIDLFYTCDKARHIAAAKAKAAICPNNIRNIPPPTLAEKIYTYCVTTLHARWPAAEQVILKDLHHTFSYALVIIKGEWPEANKLIANSIYKAYYDRLCKGEDSRSLTVELLGKLIRVG